MPAANEIRRVWEAFLRFELGQSGVANRSSIAKIQEYYRENRMRKECDFMDKFISQVYINTDSHSGHQMLGDNISLQPTLKVGDFREFIKEILCFIHLVVSASHSLCDSVEILKLLTVIGKRWMIYVRKLWVLKKSRWHVLSRLELWFPSSLKRQKKEK